MNNDTNDDKGETCTRTRSRTERLGRSFRGEAGGGDGSDYGGGQSGVSSEHPRDGMNPNVQDRTTSGTHDRSNSRLQSSLHDASTMPNTENTMPGLGTNPDSGGCIAANDKLRTLPEQPSLKDGIERPGTPDHADVANPPSRPISS